MPTFEIETHFDKGYIGHPYWPEMQQYIDITKQSGLNRARSEAGRRKAIEQYLQNNEMTLEQYEELIRLANRPFHTDNGHIIIPELHVMSMLVNTADQATSKIRPCDPKQVRVAITATPWTTTKTHPDGMWERFATPTSGTGQKLSNQRALRKNQYIEDFDAAGTLTVDEQFVDPPTLRKALDYAGKFIGIGASRKMGWGRFTVTRWAETT